MYFNCRRVRESVQKLVELSDSPDTLAVERTRYIHVGSIYLLISANKVAYGFCPGATDALLRDLSDVVVQLQESIKDKEDAIETITISDDEDDGPNMMDTEIVQMSEVMEAEDEKVQQEMAEEHAEVMNMDEEQKEEKVH